MGRGQAEDFNDDLDLLRSSAVAAGIIASGYFRRNIKSWTKENASPVSEADMVVDGYLRDTLLAARPDYGWLSEESVDGSARLSAKRVFIVDPIDGTRAFLRGEDQWSLSLAVISRGEAVAGVVYVPARDALYAAVKGGGATLNGQKLARNPEKARMPLIPAPGAVHQEFKLAGLDYRKGPYVNSLAYRLVQVASGEIDGAVARRGAQDWDIAAAAVILSEAGLVLEDVCSGVPVFNRAEVRHGALAALTDLSLKPVVHGALRRVYGCPAEEAEDKQERHIP